MEIPYLLLLRLVRLVLNKIVSVFKLWIPTWFIGILFLINIMGIIFWSYPLFSSKEFSNNILINVKNYIPIFTFISFIFLSILLIVMRKDIGLIYFSPMWKPSKFDFEKMIRNSNEIWYMTTVGRFLLKDASIQQKVSDKTSFRCLFVDPWSDYFNERMKIERPDFQNIEEARSEQLQNCKKLLKMNKSNIHVRWYNSSPVWRMLVFDKRFVAIGWFPDYSEKPTGDENKGYSGPLLVLDREAVTRNVVMKGPKNEKMIFTMSSLAEAFIKYYDAVWESANEDLILDKKSDKIVTEKSLKTLNDIGISCCWTAESDSPYSFLSLLSETNLSTYKYLELSARSSDSENIIKYLRSRGQEPPIDCSIILYDPRTKGFQKQIESERSTLNEAVLKQDYLIKQLLTAKQNSEIKNLEIRFLNEPPMFRYTIMDCRNSTKMFLGYYTRGTKGYESQLWKLEKQDGSVNNLMNLHLKYYDTLCKKAQIFNLDKYESMCESGNLLNFLDNEHPLND